MFLRAAPLSLLVRLVTTRLYRNEVKFLLPMQTDADGPGARRCLLLPPARVPRGKAARGVPSHVCDGAQLLPSL